MNAERFHKASEATTAPGDPAERPEACPIVRVHGQGATSLDEQAYTLRVNDSGGELMLSTPLCPGQELLLINEASHQELCCRISGAQRRGPRTTVIAVAFPAPHPEFWRAHSASEEQKARELEVAMRR